MLFTTVEFFIFLAVVILLIELIRHRFWQLCILLVASYFFYWYSASIHLLLLIFVTIASYYCGYRVYKSETLKIKQVWLIIGIVIPLAVLACFKYLDWGISQINDLLSVFGIVEPIPVIGILLPIGISFYTFQALSYVIDIYWKKIEHEPKFYKYALFIAFFPGLVAGPIVRASEFLPQLKSKIRITPENLQAGVTLIIWGLFKKMVIADNVGYYVNQVYADPAAYSSIMIIFATILFGIQIYCDFSGYAHIAIGVARIFGFVLPENFNLPYIAHSLQDFWRRWHMTLSRFIRDYVYIPLGGNRKGPVRTYVNLIAAMILCGLWHGAAWTFIIWGAYHGILQAIQRFSSTRIRGTGRFLSSDSGLFVKILLTQIFVFIGWMIFRANSLTDLSICVQKIICFDFNFTTFTLVATVICLVLLVLLFISMSIKPVSKKIKSFVLYDYLGKLSRVKLKCWFVFVIVVVALILLISPATTTEFIYFAF